jgi:hypothetical protein
MFAAPPSIAFFAVARIADRALLAKRFDRGTSEEERREHQAALTTLLERAKRLNYSGWKDSCLCGACGGKVFALADARAQIVVAVGVRGGLYPFPERVALQCLREFLEAEVLAGQGSPERICEATAGELSHALKPTMQCLMAKYSEPAARDKVSEVQEKVESVKCIMQDNVRLVLETHTTLETLQDRSQDLEQSANKFLKQSGDMRWQMQLRNFKMKALAAVSVGAVLLYAGQPLLFPDGV